MDSSNTIAGQSRSAPQINTLPKVHWLRWWQACRINREINAYNELVSAGNPSDTSRFLAIQSAFGTVCEKFERLYPGYLGERYPARNPSALEVALRSAERKLNHIRLTSQPPNWLTAPASTLPRPVR